MSKVPGWLKPSLNWLLIFFPLAVWAEIAHQQHAAWASATVVFAFAAIAGIPIAGWMGHATEHLASRLGEGAGGLLNATFGNAAELIIAGMALWKASRDPKSAQDMHELVKASLTGSIIGNILLVMGAALLLGGLRHKIQTFNVTAGRVGATLLMLAVVALLILGVTNVVVQATGHEPGHADALKEGQNQLQNESLELSLVLLVVYGLSLVFTLHTHKHFYIGQASVPEEKPHAEAETHAAWSLSRSFGVLLLATTCIALLAHFMVSSVEEASRAIGLSELFVGVIVVAIVGNAAEHSTAVVTAWHNRMDLSLAIAIGSSIQIALFVAPVLVLISYALGVPMNLVFSLPEILAVGMSVWIAGQIAGDGESNWLEGLLLLVVYGMLGVLFYHLPT